MPNWTEEQLSAIRARNPSLIIAAAAGSGKTAVLVERIVSLIREGNALDRMMIVTFTRAAAAEMRVRLTRRLLQEAESDPDTFLQASDDLERTEISTIHAFCQKVLRGEFQAVNIDPLARVMEEQQQKRLFYEAFHTALVELLEEKSPSVIQLTQSFDQQKLQNMTEEAYTFLMSMADPFDWLQFHVEHADDPVEDSPWYKKLLHYVKLQLAALPVQLAAMERLLSDPAATPGYETMWAADREKVGQLLKAAELTDTAFVEALAGFDLGNAIRAGKSSSDAETAWRKTYQQYRNGMKAFIREQVELISFSREGFQADMAVVKAAMEGFAILLRRVYHVFRQEKRRLGLVDFHDLEQFTLEVLRQPQLRRRLQESYDHIFVDECQDVSAIQDEIIQLLHVEQSPAEGVKTPALFMVGDVKQSIYRFRLADPTKFLRRMRTWRREDTAGERAIFLRKNFRSSSAVLEGVNAIFRRIMRQDAAELDYLPEDELIPGAGFESTPPVEVHLLHESLTGGSEGLTRLEAQVEVVVERLARLLGTPIQEGETVRPLTYRDVVILMPAVAGKGAQVAEMLTQRGIPVFFDGSSGYFIQREILAAMAILRIIDNPLQDVPLLTALKGDPFLFSDEDLAAVRLVNPERNVPFHQAWLECGQQHTPLGDRCRQAEAVLERWRFRAETMGLHAFIWMILHESGLYTACGAMPEGALRQANLRLLVDHAVAFEDTGEHSLGRFLAVVDEHLKIRDSNEAKVLQAHENIVRIMTIHKSKGLEFPVVFVLGMGDEKRHHAGTGLTLHPRLGLSMPYVNPDLRTTRPIPPMKALSLARELDERAERMRLLYVAMTRPKDRLILVGTVKEKSLQLCLSGASLGTVMQAGTLMEWVLLGMGQAGLTEALQAEKKLPLPADDPMEGMPVGEEGLFTLSLYSETGEMDAAEETVRPAADRPWESLSPEDVPAAPPWPILSPPGPPSPLKTSVTSLVKEQMFPNVLDILAEETAETKQQPELIVSPLRLPELPAAPLFITGDTKKAAHRGTVIHRALALMDMDDLKEQEQAVQSTLLAAQLDRFAARGLFTPEERAMVSPAQLTAFLQSPLGRRIMASPRVEREWSFNLRLPALRGTILQGVIDCAFLEGDAWVVADYKTDHIEDEDAFIQRYRQQLQYYGEALSILSGIPVKEKILYSLEKMKAYPL